MKLRLQKYLSEQGLASRRQAEKWIDQGRVSVNGQRILMQGVSIDPAKDIVRVGNKVVNNYQGKKEYLLLYKPKGFVCTNRRFPGEKNVFDLVKNKKKLVCVGRLDKDSEGMLLLTNDGDLTQKLTHPKNRSEKEYEITTTAPIQEDHLREMCGGIKIEGDILKIKKFKLKKPKVCTVVLTEGKKRHLRKLFARKHYKIRTLKRIRIKDLEIGSLKPGQIKPLRESNLEKLS